MEFVYSHGALLLSALTALRVSLASLWGIAAFPSLLPSGLN